MVAKGTTLLGVRLAELRVEVIDLRDHLVDALGDVLSPLVCLEQLTIEGTDPTRLLLDLASQRRSLLALTPVLLRERGNGALESLEIVGVLFGRNEGTPVHTGSYPPRRKSVKRRIRFRGERQKTVYWGKRLVRD